MTKRPSVLVIGAGHNGIVCSNYLAKAGYQVEVLEAQSAVGGGAATFEFADGFWAPGLINAPYGLNKKIYKDLGLRPRGSKTSEELNCIALDRDGNHLILNRFGLTGGEVSEKDINSYRIFRKEFTSYSKVLDPLMVDRPPRLKDMDRKDKFTLMRLGWNLRFGLGTGSMREFLRVGGINIYDVLNEYFDNPRLKAALAVDAVMGQRMGPRTPNTVLTYIQRIWAETQASTRLPTSKDILEELYDSAVSRGVNFRLDSKVTRIIVDEGQAAGVLLESGEKVSASIVISNADIKTTFLKLVGTQDLDAMFCHRIDNIRSEGNVAKIFLAVSKLPQFRNLEQKNFRHRLLIAPDQRYIEHAFNCVKYGECSDKPVLEITIPSLVDPTLAQKGFHVVSISAIYAPHNPNKGWSALRTVFLDNILSSIEQYAPGFVESVVAKKILTPADVEEQYNNLGGHWHHGELSLDQSFIMRPVYGASQYDTPIQGLYLCGAGTHPGGGMTGVPGHNAAKRVLELAGSA